jgi:osmotically-inducible protein OsmY
MLSILPAPPPAQESDDLSLERTIREEIRRRCERCVRGMAIWVDDGVVTLRGQTRSFYEKQLVLNAAQQVSGVREIADEVMVAAR